MRQIIGVFDEDTSRENGKNVTRAMRKSAKQGFWNGARPPLGYRTYEAERRGSKIKKRLEIDPVEAETVRLIFRLHAEGDGVTGPLGIKDTCSWLNAHGYRTRLGAAFGVEPVHSILKNAGEAFSALMREKLENGDMQARKAYLRAVIADIEVDDDKVRIVGEKAALADVIAGRQTSGGNVSGSFSNGAPESYRISS